MRSNFNHRKTTFRSADFWVGAVFFTLLLWLAWDLFLERICFMDSAAYTVEMLKKQGFAIVHDRIGAAFSQLIPLTLLYFKAPLKVVMIGYSVNFVVLYFLCFWFCLSVCRHRPSAYAICLLMVYSVNMTFFWPVTELFQGIIFCVMFFAWWNSTRPINTLVYSVVAILLCMLALRTHSLTIVGLLFLFVFDFLDQTERKTRDRVLRLCLLLLPITFVLFFRSNSPYEEARMAFLGHTWEILPNVLDLPGTRMIWACLTGKYAMLMVGASIMVLVLIWKRKWLKLGLAIAFHVAYGLMLCITYPYGATDLAFENLFFPFALCQLVLICQELLAESRRPIHLRIALAVLTVLFLFRIREQKSIIRHKIKNYQAIVNSLRDEPTRKFALTSWNFPHNINQMTWPSFAESLLFSGLEGPDKSLSIFVAEDGDMESLRNIEPADDLFLDYPWDPIGSQRKLPRHYFDLPSQPYQFLNSSNVVSGDSMISLLAHAGLAWADPLSGFTAGTKPWCKLRIYNDNEDPIPSRCYTATSVMVSYRFYFDGELVDWRPPPCPLLMDVKSMVEQLVPVEIPEQAEDIEIQFGLVGQTGDQMYLTSPRYPITIYP